MVEADRIRFERVRPLRAREYMRLVEAGEFEGEPIELLGGVLVRMSPQGNLHADVVRYLAERLVLVFRGKHWFVRSHSGLEISDDSVPEPDIAVVPAAKLGAPARKSSLVIEVSVSSLRFDRTVKRPFYAAAGVPELWIVDVKNRRVEVHTQPDARARRYARVTVLTYGDTLRPIRHRRVAIPVSSVLPPPTRRTRQ